MLLWFSLLLISVISHSTHLAVALLLLPLSLTFSKFFNQQTIVRPLLLCMGAIAIAVAGSLFFTQAVKMLYGYKPLPLPMIAASVITDGPGRAFLEENCPAVGYIYCKQINTGAKKVDEFLWSRDEAVGVYLFADAETKRLMSEQQFQFLFDTLRYDASGQILASLAKFKQQLFDNTLSQLTYGNSVRKSLMKLPEPDRSIAEQSGYFRGTFSLEGFGQVAQVIAFAATLISLCAAIVLLLQRSDATSVSGDASLRALVTFSFIILSGVLLNAGLTGAASQPQGRYSARVILLLPILSSIWWAWIVRNNLNRVLK